ncbi:MAG: family 16 glycosylhydrolase [Bacteroidales bacterium]
MQYLKARFPCLIFLVFASACSTIDYSRDWKLEWEADMSGERDDWHLTHGTFRNNLSGFHPRNVEFLDSLLALNLNYVPDADTPVSGAEIRTAKAYPYGLIEVRMKAAKGSGLISSFFTLKDPARPGNEIDVEIMGKNTYSVLTNYWDASGRQYPKTRNTGFDASEGFHHYAIAWAPGKITWYIDGKRIRTARKNIPEPGHLILFNLWMSANHEWAGHPDRSALPARAFYKDLKFYLPK